MPLWRLQQIYRDDSASLEGVVGSGSMRGLCCQQSLRNHRAAHWFPAPGWFHMSRHCFAYVPIFTQMVVTACRVSDQHCSSQRTRDGEFCGSHCRTSVLVTDSTWIQTLLLLQHPDFCHSRFLINTRKFAPTLVQGLLLSQSKLTHIRVIKKPKGNTIVLLWHILRKEFWVLLYPLCQYGYERLMWV